ncbi:hypothetical protein [Leuconostoc gelidum]|uniref:hypothetical protein n=1 Tax=Leuconostoc gelidum TaxID=1244 RepID=UPI00021923E9|nr:hypothetical protein [Leuconostoc gelidum]GMA66785.1 hypothetical protein GCM10025884_04120 [Leuconostoc gelidum subsp. gelidum]
MKEIKLLNGTGIEVMKDGVLLKGNSISFETDDVSVVVIKDGNKFSVSQSDGHGLESTIDTIDDEEAKVTDTTHVPTNHELEQMSIKEINGEILNKKRDLQNEREKLESLYIIRSSKIKYIFNKNIVNTIKFNESNPSVDIVVLEDGTFVIVDADELLTNPEKYVFDADGLKARIVEGHIFGRYVIVEQTTPSGIYHQFVDEETFRTPISERV